MEPIDELITGLVLLRPYARRVILDEMEGGPLVLECEPMDRKNKRPFGASTSKACPPALPQAATPRPRLFPHAQRGAAASPPF